MANIQTMPSGWDCRYDESSGKYYYINHKTKTTTWEDPRLHFRTLHGTPKNLTNIQTEHVPLQHGSPDLRRNYVYPAQTSPIPAFQMPAHMSPKNVPVQDVRPRMSPLTLKSSKVQDSYMSGSTDTEEAVAKISAMFPTVSETHIKLLLKKYHNREALVISALKVEKNPITTPGPFATPPPQRNIHHPGVHMTPPLGFHANSRGGSPIFRPGSCSNCTYTGSPRIGDGFRSSPRPHSSPKLKLRYMKSIFPEADETLILDMLQNNDNNIQKVSDALKEMGYNKKDTLKVAQQKMEAKKEEKRKEEEKIEEQLPSPQIKINSKEEKEQLKKNLQEKYEEVPEHLISIALESVNFDENRANQILQIMIQEDTQAADNKKMVEEQQVAETDIDSKLTVPVAIPISQSRQSLKSLLKEKPDKEKSTFARLIDEHDSVQSKHLNSTKGHNPSFAKGANEKLLLKLGEMTLLEPLVGQTLTNLIYTYIHGHIQKICKDSFDSSFISVLEKWLQTVVIHWLRKIYSYDTSQSSHELAVEMFDKKLINYLYNSYTKIRIDQLFNIIIEYPESLPALEDLRLCLPRTDLKPLLTKKLQKAMETRLLHPGVSTPDVLTAYVAAIRSLRILDPTGLLLETVTQPIHQYLRSREDTVRCVVSSLTEEGPNDLAEELVRGEAVQVDENTPVDEDSENWETWVPDPIDTVPSKSSTHRRTSDIISMLVNVYGSKELFVNEYRTLLADRLLTQYSCDTEKEIRYLELLKLRFGDSQLHYCEVMLKDIADSKRINQHIKQDPEYSENDIPMSAMIVSAQFWPPFKEEKLELHNRLVTQMESYTSAFETLKGSRTLCWKNHLGVVDLEIELADRTLNLSASPVQATIMMYFQDKSVWELEELSKVMQCPPTILRRKIGFWQSHGIIVETKPDVFCIQEDQESKDNNIQEDIFVEDYESESAMASAQDQREEELQTFWSYIVGMLMNLDTLPLERIHQMLKMFAFQGPTIECSLQELKVFLDRKGLGEKKSIFLITKVG